MKDETFGPILGVQKVSSDEEAINLMNDSEFGLTGSIWTKNTDGKAEELADQVEAGTVFINRFVAFVIKLTVDRIILIQYSRGRGSRILEGVVHCQSLGLSSLSGTVQGITRLFKISLCKVAYSRPSKSSGTLISVRTLEFASTSIIKHIYRYVHVIELHINATHLIIVRASCTCNSNALNVAHV
jgi:hypothetical protein